MNYRSCPLSLSWFSEKLRKRKKRPPTLLFLPPFRTPFFLLLSLVPSLHQNKSSIRTSPISVLCLISPPYTLNKGFKYKWSRETSPREISKEAKSLDYRRRRNSQGAATSNSPTSTSFHCWLWTKHWPQLLRPRNKDFHTHSLGIGSGPWSQGETPRFFWLLKWDLEEWQSLRTCTTVKQFRNLPPIPSLLLLSSYRSLGHRKCWHIYKT